MVVLGSQNLKIFIFFKESKSCTQYNLNGKGISSSLSLKKLYFQSQGGKWLTEVQGNYFPQRTE